MRDVTAFAFSDYLTPFANHMFGHWKYFFENWRKRRSVKRQLREIDSEFAPEFKAAGDNEDERSKVMAKYKARIQEPWEQLRWSKTNRLRVKAFRLGIELPRGDEEDCWDPAHFLEVHGDTYVRGSLLTPKGIAIVSRQISEARLNYYKQWVQVISPLATVLISLLALVISAIALYLQLSGIPSIPPVK